MTSIFPDFGNNYRYPGDKYRLGIYVDHLPLCKLYKCFDFYLHNIVADH